MKLYEIKDIKLNTQSKTAVSLKSVEKTTMPNLAKVIRLVMMTTTMMMMMIMMMVMNGFCRMVDK